MNCGRLWSGMEMGMGTGTGTGVKGCDWLTTSMGNTTLLPGPRSICAPYPKGHLTVESHKTNNGVDYMPHSRPLK